MSVLRAGIWGFRPGQFSAAPLGRVPAAYPLLGFTRTDPGRLRPRPVAESRGRVSLVRANPADGRRARARRRRRAGASPPPLAAAGVGREAVVRHVPDSFLADAGRPGGRGPIAAGRNEAVRGIGAGGVGAAVVVERPFIRLGRRRSGRLVQSAASGSRKLEGRIAASANDRISV